MALIGAHVSIRGGLHRAIERGESLSCEAIQIFTKNQLQWKSPPLKLEHSIVFYKKWQESYVKDIVAHASYLINLASEGDLRFKSISAAVDEVSRLSLIHILHWKTCSKRPMASFSIKNRSCKLRQN